MGHLFISYSHTDEAYAHKLAKALRTRGFDAWIDDQINYGTKWPQVLEDRLDTCDAFIVIVSKSSSESDWVQSEVARAKRKGKPIFPLLLSGETWLAVETMQYVDVRNRSLPPEEFYECLRLATNEPDLQPPKTNSGSNEGTKKAGRGCEIEVGRMLRIAVLFTLLAVFMIFSIRSLPLSHPPTPTPLQSGPTWTATSALGLTPSDTPRSTFTPVPTTTSTSTPAPLVIVNTGSLMGWVPDFNNAKDDKTKNKIETYENAIKLTYAIGPDGYVVITKSFDPKLLADTNGISFMYSGMGAYNTIEFKLLLRYPDHPGDTIYGIVWTRATNTDGKWVEVKVPYTDIWCWGPAADCADHPEVDTTVVDRLDFAVSNKPADDPGLGWVLIKDVFGMKP